jgi:hypothetical protein
MFEVDTRIRTRHRFRARRRSSRLRTLLLPVSLQRRKEAEVSQMLLAPPRAHVRVADRAGVV